MQTDRFRRGGFFGLMALGLMVLTSEPARAVTSNGPYYAEPSWDQKLPAATRFVVLADWNNEAVLDRETGLVWEQSPATTTHAWVNVRFHCASLTTGGRKGWRLPSVHELASLIDPSVASPGPTLPPGHPFTNVATDPSLGYWSATTRADWLTRAWSVGFFVGLVHSDEKSSSLRVWCVRGGSNADQY